MKLHIRLIMKNILSSQVQALVNEIIELQKEQNSSHIFWKKKKEVIKRILSAEEEASSEYMQSKYISNVNSLKEQKFV